MNKANARTANRDYEVFEQFSDGSVVLWDVVQGFNIARARVEKLAAVSPNEFFALDALTQGIAVRVNLAGTVRG